LLIFPLYAYAETWYEENISSAAWTEEAISVSEGNVVVTPATQNLNLNWYNILNVTTGYFDNLKVTGTITGIGFSDISGSISDSQIPSAITRDTEWDTQGKIETVIGTTLATDAEVAIATSNISASDVSVSDANNRWGESNDVEDALDEAGEHINILSEGLSHLGLNHQITATAGVPQWYFYDVGGSTYTEFHISGKNYVVPNSSVTLAVGTDSAPVWTYIWLTPDGDSVNITTGTSYPTSGDYAQIGNALIGSCSGSSVTVYLMNSQEEKIDEYMRFTADRIRLRATWDSGCQPTITGNDISVTEGTIYQMHAWTFPALDTSSGDTIKYRISSSSWVELPQISSFTVYHDGSSISNNKYVPCVIWGMLSDTTKYCHLMINLPADNSTEYNKKSDAIADVYGISNYTVPSVYHEVGFLICRVIVKCTGSPTDTWTLQTFPDGSYYQDLRGVQLTGGGAGGEFVGGDMFKIEYDTDNDGVVDNAEKLGGHTSDYFEPVRTKKWFDVQIS